MNTKLLYVLVSSEKDIFWEQTYLSVYSVRQHNPSITISVLMDDVTYMSLVGVRNKLLEWIDEPIVINLDNKLSNMMKSRYLKTNVRNYVLGDFLYIDSDTIILDDLSKIDSFKFEMGAVYEFNRKLADNTGRRSLEEVLSRFGLHLDGSDEYYNSGVVFVRDTPGNHAFFNEWFNKWLDGTKNGVYFDQLSLGFTNKAHHNYIKPLGGEWNCQGKYCINYVREARIFHYLFDSAFEFPLMCKDAFIELKKTGNINSLLLSIVENPFRHISPKNKIITGNDFLILEIRQYALLYLIYNKYYRLFSFVEKALKLFNSIILMIRYRKFLPPR